ncbi:MAG TPA: hypothetical protein VIC85_02260 [Ktedonobacterales bacterium]
MTDDMSIQEAVARGYNFFVVAFLGIVGGTLVGELSQEGPWLFKLDELLLITIGIVAIVWYWVGRNRFQRSPVPLILAVLAFLAKVLGLIIEFKDVIEAGDDFGLVQSLFVFMIVAAVAYYLTRPAALEAAGTPAARQTPTRTVE